MHSGGGSPFDFGSGDWRCPPRRAPHGDSGAGAGADPLPHPASLHALGFAEGAPGAIDGWPDQWIGGGWPQGAALPPHPSARRPPFPAAPLPPWARPSGPRARGVGVDDEFQGIVDAGPTATGGSSVRVTLLAAGFVIGPGGASVRDVCRASGADVRSFTGRRPGERPGMRREREAV
jgi:hypothetical protein